VGKKYYKYKKGLGNAHPATREKNVNTEHIDLAAKL
jgi:hypothetical protein